MEAKLHKNKDLQNTKDRILQAAEYHFATNGFAGTSVRDITNDAEVNVASINYYFGDKESLFLEVIRRRMEPFHLTRLERLESAEKNAQGRPLTINEILDAFISPMLEIGLTPEGKCTLFLKLMERSFLEKSFLPQKLPPSNAEECRNRFDAAFIRALGEKMSPDDILWRVRFTMDLVHQVMLAQDTDRPVPPSFKKELFDIDVLKRRIIAYASAGFQAVV